MALRSTEVADLLTLHEEKYPKRRGFLTRTCFYWYVAMSNTSQVGFSSIDSLHRRVMSHDRINEAVSKTLEEQRDDSLAVQGAMLKVESTAKGMIGTVTSRVIRFCGWIYLTLLKQVCGSVQFNPKQIEVIREISEKSCPIIYMPLHFSHLDYILLSLVLFHNNIKVPYIASGNNLHLPIIGYFIKRAGGFFIRRKMEENGEKDHIYRAVLQVYITELLKDGQSIEVFLEGTRSRSGLPNIPKTGFLSLLVDAVVHKNIDDAMIVPVHTSYEKLLEGNFHAELLGKPKTPESLWDTCKSVAKLFFGHYGHIKLNFAKPISLKTALREVCQYSSRTSSSSCLISVDDNDVKDDSTALVLSRQNVSNLGEHIVYHGMTSGSFMSSHLVAYLLINQFREGVLLNDLLDAYCRLKSHVMSRGRDLGFSGDPEVVILRALDLFDNEIIDVQCISGNAYQRRVSASSNEILTDDDSSEKADSGIFVNGGDDTVINFANQSSEKSTLFIKPNVSIPSIFELSYYANALTPLFAIESVICLAVNAVTDFQFSMIQDLWKFSGSVDIFEDTLPRKMKSSFRRSDLTEKTMELCDILQIDLILCDVLANLEYCIQDRVQELISSGCFQSTIIGRTKQIHQSYGIDDDFDGVEDELLKVNPNLIPQFVSYQSVLAPFVEAASCVAEQLPILATPTPQKEFLSKIRCHAQSRVRDGLARRPEFCSSELLTHCIRAFEMNCVISRTDDRKLAILDAYNDAAYLNNLLTKVQSFLM